MLDASQTDAVPLSPAAGKSKERPSLKSKEDEEVTVALTPRSIDAELRDADDEKKSAARKEDVLEEKLARVAENVGKQIGADLSEAASRLPAPLQKRKTDLVRCFCFFAYL